MRPACQANFEPIESATNAFHRNELESVRRISRVLCISVWHGDCVKPPFVRRLGRIWHDSTPLKEE